LRLGISDCQLPIADLLFAIRIHSIATQVLKLKIIENVKSAIGNLKSAIGNLKSAIGNRKSTNGGRCNGKAAERRSDA
jgi:hypothetical protein